ncbi:MAG: polyprenyl synthetase family protein [Nitrospinota bacterium]
MNSRFEDIRREVDDELRNVFDTRGDIPKKLLESMRYSIFAGGKRLRPTLVALAAEAVGGDRRAAMPTAAAFEIIHTYTLIHDDLPAMDDDDLRRGLPTNHIKFGEATAILAGDSLLTLAFELMAKPLPEEMGVSPSVQLEVVRRAAVAVGAQGTVGGQQIDLQSEGKNGDMELLQQLHDLKTGAMIGAAVECGGLLGGADENELAALSLYGKKIGLAFQIIDDILDVTGDSEKLGKKTGMDEQKSKMTYPAMLGLEKSKVMGEELVEQAVGSIKGLRGDTGPLAELARYITVRTN